MTDLTIFHPTLGAATARKIRNDRIKEAEAYRLSKKAMAGSPRLQDRLFPGIADVLVSFGLWLKARYQPFQVS